MKDEDENRKGIPMKKYMLLAISGCMLTGLLAGCGNTAAGPVESKKAVEEESEITEQTVEESEITETTETTKAETADITETADQGVAESDTMKATGQSDETNALQVVETERETGKPIYQKYEICGDFQVYGFWSYIAQDYQVNYDEVLFDMIALTEEEEADIEAYAMLFEEDPEAEPDEAMEELCARKSNQTMMVHFSPDGSGTLEYNDYLGLGKFEGNQHTLAWMPDKKNPKDYLWQLDPIPETQPASFYPIYSYGDGVYQMVVEKADTDHVKDGLIESGLFIKRIDDAAETEDEASETVINEKGEETEAEQAVVINEYGVNTAYVGNWESSIVAYDYGTIETDEIHGSMILYEDGTGIFFTQEDGSFEIAWGVIEDGDCYITREDEDKTYSGTIIDGEASVMEDRQYLYTMHQTSSIPDKSKIDNNHFVK